MIDWFRCSWVFLSCVLDLYQARKSLVGSPRGKEIWKLSPLTVISIIWKERNSRIFEGRAKKGGSLVGEIYGRFLDLAESSL